MRKRSIHELSKEFDAIEPSLMEVRPSNIAGRGLFTTVPLKKGSVLGEYTGRPIDSKTHSSDIGDYVMFTSRGPIDAYDDTLMRYVNHRTTKDGPNVITRELLAPLPRVFLVTTRHVKKDEEFFFDYGPDYIWKKT
jgi:SET domain-containing protein